jgi:HK97 family phage major capsid protein
MAAKSYAAWIPVQDDPGIITQVNAMSAIAKVARKEPMSSRTKVIGRSPVASVGLVAAGAAYGEEATAVSEITLKNFKWGKQVRIDELEAADTHRGILGNNLNAFNRAFATQLDLACIGISIAQSDTESTGAPYTSIIRTLVTGADTFDGYGAGDNHDTVATAPTFLTLSHALGLVERGNYFDEAGMVWIMDPAVKESLRELMDDQSRPIFADNIAMGSPSTLFGYPINWTIGARVADDMTAVPAAALGVTTTAGNSLCVIANRNYLALGERGGEETQLVPPMFSGTDEIIQRWRSRKAFNVTVPGACAVVEVVSP